MCIKTVAHILVHYRAVCKGHQVPAMCSTDITPTKMCVGNNNTPKITGTKV